MRDHRGRAWTDAGTCTAVLPAEGATLATTLTGGLVLVAHTGRAHLGIRVDRALLAGIARTQAFLDDGDPVTAVDLPEAVPFRDATSRTLAVSDGHVHLTLHATGDPGRTDAHVELRLEPPLLRRLAQHHDRRRRRRLLALTGCLAVLGLAAAVVGTLAQGLS